MVLDYWSPIRANVSDSEHNQTHARRQPTRVTGCSWCRVLFYDCVCLVVCFNLRPKTAISRGEQNRYGWRRRTLLTTRLIKFYGGLRLMKSTAAYGGLWRRLGALIFASWCRTFYNDYVATRRCDKHKYYSWRTPVGLHLLRRQYHVLVEDCTIWDYRKMTVGDTDSGRTRLCLFINIKTDSFHGCYHRLTDVVTLHG